MPGSYAPLQRAADRALQQLQGGRGAAALVEEPSGADSFAELVDDDDPDVETAMWEMLCDRFARDEGRGSEMSLQLCSWLERRFGGSSEKADEASEGHLRVMERRGGGGGDGDG